MILVNKRLVIRSTKCLRAVHDTIMSLKIPFPIGLQSLLSHSVTCQGEVSCSRLVGTLDSYLIVSTFARRDYLACFSTCHEVERLVKTHLDCRWMLADA